MSNEYDALIEPAANDVQVAQAPAAPPTPAGAPPPAVTNEYDALVVNLDQKRQEKIAARTSIMGAQGSNPDTTAQAIDLGKKTGLPVDTVERNLPVVQKQASANEYDALLDKSPGLTKWLADQTNAKVSGDDYEKLADIERRLRPPHLYTKQPSKAARSIDSESADWEAKAFPNAGGLVYDHLPPVDSPLYRSELMTGVENIAQGGNTMSQVALLKAVEAIKFFDQGGTPDRGRGGRGIGLGMGDFSRMENDPKATPQQPRHDDVFGYTKMSADEKTALKQKIDFQLVKLAAEKKLGNEFTSRLPVNPNVKPFLDSIDAVDGKKLIDALTPSLETVIRALFVVPQFKQADGPSPLEDVGKAFAKDPAGIVQNLTMTNVPQMAVIAPAALTGPLAPIFMGAAGMALDFPDRLNGIIKDTLLEQNTIASAGPDPDDPFAVQKYLRENPAVLQKVTETAAAASMAISSGEVMAFLATKPIPRGKGVKAIVTTGAYDAAVGVAGEGVGELAAQTVADHYSASDLAAEMIGAGPNVVVNTAVKTAQEASNASAEAKTEAAVKEVKATIVAATELLTDLQTHVAEKKALSLDDLIEKVQASKLNERSPDKMREFLETVLGAEEEKTVFVPAETVATYMQDMTSIEAANFADRLGITDQLARARVSNEDIAIPLARYVTAASEAHKAWRDDIRTEVEGFSVNQAKDYEKTRTAETQAILQRFEEGIAAGVQLEPRQIVQDKVFAQLKETGLPTRQAASNAALLAGHANAMATLEPTKYADALDFYEKHPIRFESENTRRVRELAPDRLDILLESIRSGKDPLSPPVPDAHVKARADAAALELTSVLGPGPEKTPAQIAKENRKAAQELFKADRENLAGMLAEMGVDPKGMSNDDIRAAIQKAVAERAEGRTFEQGIGHNSPPITNSEKEEALTANALLDPNHPRNKPRSRTVEEVAIELQARGQAALKALGIKSGRIEGPSEETDALLSRVIASEIKGALQRDAKRSALNWYTQRVREAMAIAGVIYPEINTDEHAKFAFTVALAVTSQGEIVPSNVRLTDEVYAYFREHRRFPTEVKAKETAAINGNFVKMNYLLDELGEAGTREFMSAEFTVAELEAEGYEIGGELVSTSVRGSAILGPKIGGGFFQNLNGNYDPVTMDLWFMRAWGRLTGTLVGKVDTSKQRGRLERALAAAGEKVPKRIDVLSRVADEIVAEHERNFRNFRSEYDDGTRVKSELVNAAQRLQAGLSGINQAPTSGGQRNWMRDVIAGSRAMLAEAGMEMTPADLQAVWWYPEKELYGKLGGKGRASDEINVDYSGSLRALALTKPGIDAAAIDAAVRALDNGPGSAAQADDTGAGEGRSGGNRAADGEAQGAESQDPVDRTYNQEARGSITFDNTGALVRTFAGRDPSTVLHELWHYFHNNLEFMARAPDASPEVKAMYQATLDYAGVKGENLSLTPAEWDRYRALGDKIKKSGKKSLDGGETAEWTVLLGRVEQNEVVARAGEAFLLTGKSPSEALASAFRAFKNWLITVYRSVKRLNVPVSAEFDAVMAQMIATREEIEAAQNRQGLNPVLGDAKNMMSEAERDAYTKRAEQVLEEADDKVRAKVMAPLRRAAKSLVDDVTSRIKGEVTAEAMKDPGNAAMYLLRNGKLFDSSTAGTPAQIEEATKAVKTAEVAVRMFSRGNGTNTPERAQELLSGAQATLATAQARLTALSGAKSPPVKPLPIKLSRPALVAIVGEDGLKNLPSGIHADDGMDLTTVAQMVGLGNGQELVERLMQVQTDQKRYQDDGGKGRYVDDQIHRETHRRVLEEIGDPLNDGSLEKEVEDAIRSDKQGALMAFELKILARKAGHSGVVSLEDITAWADGAIAEMSQYQAVQFAKYQRAERTAGIKVQQALLKGDIVAAFKAKQDQLVNFALYKAAKKAAEDTDKITGYLDKLAGARTIKALDQDYLDTIHEMLEEYDFKRRSGPLLAERTLFNAYKAEQLERGVVVQEPPRLKGAERKHFSQMSMEELRDFYDTIKQIDRLGRKKKELFLDGKKRELEATLTEMEAAAAAGVQRGSSLSTRGLSDLEKSVGKAKHWLRVMNAELLKVERLLEFADGDKTGRGIFTRMIYRPIADAAAATDDRRVELGKKQKAIYEKVPEAQRHSWAELHVLPELGGIKLDKEAIIAIALNMGNASNLEKLLLGEKWTEDGVRAAVNKHLTQEEWTFVQDMWDLIDSQWPEAAVMIRDVEGVEPPSIEAVPLQTPYGTLKGGYYPVEYARNESLKGDKVGEMQDSALLVGLAPSPRYGRPSSKAGSTNARTEFNAPFNLSLSVIGKHLDEITHDIFHRRAVADIFKIVSNDRFREAIRSRLGAEYEKVFLPWLKRVANEARQNNSDLRGWDNAMKTLRVNVTMMAMGLRVSTMVQQVAGYANSLQRLGSKDMLAGMAEFWPNPGRAAKQVYALSGEMRHRANNLERDVKANLDKFRGKSTWKASLGRFAFRGIALGDLSVSIPTWLGAYRKGLADGFDDADAIAYADKMVRDTQGSGGSKDLSSFQNGSETWKIMGMFYNILNVFYNAQQGIVEDARKPNKSFSDYADIAWQVSMLMIVSPIMVALLSGQGPDDDEDKLYWAMRQAGFGAFSGIPIVRDLMGTLSREMGGKPSAGFKMSPVAGPLEGSIHLVKDLTKVVSGDEMSKNFFKNTFNVVGGFAGLPTGQIGVTSQFLFDSLISGAENPNNLLDWMRGLTFGPERKK